MKGPIVADQATRRPDAQRQQQAIQRDLQMRVPLPQLRQIPDLLRAPCGALRAEAPARDPAPFWDAVEAEIWPPS